MKCSSGIHFHQKNVHLLKFILLLLFSTIIVEPLNAIPVRRVASGRHKILHSTKYLERFYPHQSTAHHKPSFPKTNFYHHLNNREVGRYNCTTIRENLAEYEKYFEQNEEVFLKDMHNLTLQNVSCLKGAILCYKPKTSPNEARNDKTFCNDDYGTVPVVCPEQKLRNYSLEALLKEFLNVLENVNKMRMDHEMSDFINSDGQAYQNYKMQATRLLDWMNTLPFDKKNLEHHNNATYYMPKHTKAYTLYITYWNQIQRYQDLINQKCPS